ncbi:hypothetical protein [Leifsonia poae]|uniref:hypothetical protein n=1 Tax=Leifsonia poae TaxID=110933 RepID=UPI003D67043F
MATSTAPSTGHVVRLLDVWSEPSPPTALPLRGRMRPATVMTLLVLLLIASIGGAAGVVLLWSQPTPGWWFSLIFTVMIGGLLFTLWFAYVGSIADGRLRAVARQRWADGAGRIHLESGTIRQRTVSTLEDGRVDTFTLAVTISDGGTVNAVWHRPTARAAGLLQPQVPSAGAMVRVWRVAGAPAEWPLLIEAVDPSIVSEVPDM